MRHIVKKLFVLVCTATLFVLPISASAADHVHQYNVVTSEYVYVPFDCSEHTNCIKLNKYSKTTYKCPICGDSYGVGNFISQTHTTVQ